MKTPKKLKKEKYIYEDLRNGYHYFRIQIPLPNGTTFTKSINAAQFANAKDAQKFAVMQRDKALTDLHVGKLITSSPTVGTLFDEALNSFGITEKTRKKWLQAFQALDQFRNVPIDKVTTADVNKTLVDYAQDHTAERVSRVKSVWNKIYLLAQMKDIPVPNRAQLVQLPKSNVLPKSREKVTITEDDFFTFIQWLDDALPYTHDQIGRHRNRQIKAACLVMWYTGIRPQEAFALQRESVDLIQRVLKITRSVGSTASGTRKFKTTKTKQSVRSVPICDDLVPVLVDLLRSTDAEDLFLDSDGLPYEIDVVSNFVSKAAKQAGVKYTMYMCRHTVATKLFNENVPQQVTRDILGHASASMSLSYARSTDEQKAEALKKLS